MIYFDNNRRYTDWKNRWEDKSNLNEIQYIDDNIHPEDLLILVHLFYPKVVSHNNGYFLELNYSEEISDKINQEQKISSIEREYNKVWIYDMFSSGAENVSELAFEQIGQTLKSAWESHLSHTFPQKKFIVELIIDDRNYGPILTFYQM